MQAASIETRIGRLPALSRAGKRINGLHRLMRSSHLYELAYMRVSRNQGALTPGIDGATFDGMSLEKIARLTRQVAEGSYRPRPVRRVYIPKANGKTRPLGIPTVEDRLVQEVVRTILQAIYEPVFLNESHGFRPGRSCHTALEKIQRTWTGTKWLIEVDVRGFFDNIDHDVLLGLLERRIDDPRFVGLIRAMLEAGYMEDWTVERTYSGTPQGGVVSPLLANIYLHELDLFMSEMKAGFDRGAKRRVNPAYKSAESAIRRLRRKIDAIRATGADEAEVSAAFRRIADLDEVRRTLPSVDPMDPNFRRLRYCRYADDFLIGVIGSKEEARAMMATVQAFLAERLRLDVSVEKSGISDASKGSRFLGYDIRTVAPRRPAVMVERRRADGSPMRVPRRPSTGNVRLSVPRDRVTAFCRRNGYGNLEQRRADVRPQFLSSSDAEIIVAYNAEFRGFANYYALANGVKRSLSLLELIVTSSLFKTIANRHQTSVRKTSRRLRTGSGYALEHIIQDEPRVLGVWLLKHLRPRSWTDPVVDIVSTALGLARSRNDLVTRLNARLCEACGNRDGPFEVHHVRRLKDVQDRPISLQRGVSRLRKTTVLCKPCHVARHTGRQRS
jgi:group II intron reverse transcriptase/maturase